MAPQLPDVDAILQFADTPQLRVPPPDAAPAAAQTPGAKGSRAAAGGAAALPGPVLAPCSNKEFLDVPFPDWTHWGIGVRPSPPAGLPPAPHLRRRVHGYACRCRSCLCAPVRAQTLPVRISKKVKQGVLSE